MRFELDPVRVLAYGSFFGAMLTWSLVDPAQMSAVAEGSEHAFFNREYVYGGDCIRNVGYGMWQHAARATFS